MRPPVERATPVPQQDAGRGDTAYVLLRDRRDATEALRTWSPPDPFSLALCIRAFARERNIAPADVEYRVQWPESSTTRPA